jgi:hypothetical protein
MRHRRFLAHSRDRHDPDKWPRLRCVPPTRTRPANKCMLQKVASTRLSAAAGNRPPSNVINSTIKFGWRLARRVRREGGGGQETLLRPVRLQRFLALLGCAFANLGVEYPSVESPVPAARGTGGGNLRV